jgi:conjugative transfer signal peptidase TraF
MIMRQVKWWLPAWLAFALIGVIVHQHLHVNTSGSVPIAYAWAADPAVIDRGDLVEACPAYVISKIALDRGYVARGSCPNGTVPFLKLVAAVGGDRVSIDARGVAVNGRLLANSAAHSTDKRGRWLPALPHISLIMPLGKVWLYGTDGWSIDSRYVGPVGVESIRYRDKPFIAYAPMPDLR